MRFGSVCSGIEAASVAWGPLGWHAAWFSEIEQFPAAVLAHHYPTVPNLGDMTHLAPLIRAGLIEAPDLLAGGTPCQAFSVAGLRGSLGDARGNLTLTYCEIANAIDDRRAELGLPPAIDFWENVPGVLSTEDNAFGCFLAGLAGEDDALVPPGPRLKWPNAGCVFGPRRTVAWRILDAQYFGLAQRRRRVYVVASARADFDPAEVLFEFEGVRRDSAPRRGEGEEVAAGTLRSTDGGSDVDHARAGHLSVVGTLQANQGPNAHGHGDFLSNQAVNAGHILAFGGNDTRGPIDVATAVRAKGGTGHGDFESETFIAFDTTQLTSAENRSNPKPGDPCHTLNAKAHVPAVAYAQVVADPISANEQRTYTHKGEKNFRTRNVTAVTGMQARRLTVVECERLQGFPDNYTLLPGDKRWKLEADERAYIKWHMPHLSDEETERLVSDGPRYKAIGNSWPVTVITWIGWRIARQLNDPTI